MQGGYAVMARAVKRNLPEAERNEFAERVAKELAEVKAAVEMLSLLVTI
jgi:hypothetical protein